MKVIKRLLTLSIWCAICSTPAHAVVLAQYSFPGDPGGLAPTTVQADVSASNVNFTGSAASQYTGIAGLFILNVPSGAINAANAVALNSFFAFTVSPGSNHQLDLSSLTFDAAYGVISGVAVRSSLDGFASNLYDAPVPNGFGSGFVNYSVNLGTPVFQGLSLPVTFRLYGYYLTGNSVNNPILGFDNLTLNGTVAAVPEPATGAMLSLGLLAVGLMRRGRQRRR